MVLSVAAARGFSGQACEQMTPNDEEYFQLCHRAGLVKEPILDVGSARIGDQPNISALAKRAGLKAVKGADLAKGKDVDYVADFGLEPSEFQHQFAIPTFSTVCVFNVLEHTFDPIRVLSNALSCVDEAGTLLVLTPSIWPIHNYPGDYNRLLPDWYREFAKRRNLQLADRLFSWISEFGIEPIVSEDSDFPTYRSRRSKASPVRYWKSKIGHRLLNSYGRSHWATHCSIGAAFVCRPV